MTVLLFSEKLAPGSCKSVENKSACWFHPPNHLSSSSTSFSHSQPICTILTDFSDFYLYALLSVHVYHPLRALLHKHHTLSYTHLSEWCCSCKLMSSVCSCKFSTFILKILQLFFPHNMIYISWDCDIFLKYFNLSSTKFTLLWFKMQHIGQKIQQLKNLQ